MFTENKFNRMVMPKVNVHRFGMAHLMDTTNRDSMINATMTDAEGLMEIMPNLDTKFSILPYKFTDDGPDDDKSRLLSCMGLSFDNTYKPNIPMDFFARQLTEEEVVQFLKLFKIESDNNDPIEALLI
jgi:hypothetical protein